jgi:hypothetical protein
VQRFRFSAALRWPAIFVMLAAWLLASNRCAFAQIGSGTPAAKGAGMHQCCHEETSVPAPQPEKSPMQSSDACCQHVHGLPVNAAADDSAKAPVTLVYFALAWAEISTIAEQTGPQESETEAGPPGHNSFSETTLQRSLQSHAPPASA